MDGARISEVVTASAKAVYDYVEAMQYATDPPIGVSVSEAVAYEVHDEYAILRLDSRLQDTSGLMLMVDGAVLDEEASGFSRYDEISRTVVVHPGPDVLGLMATGSPVVRVLSDMKFLISVAGEFYRRYGRYLTIPECRPVASSPVFPDGSEPTYEQRRAVACVLSSPLSYIWGAPGTGKTQYVLATCIRACLDAGRRVAVFAPTNNSVEQVLGGLIRAFEGTDGILDSILRLGVPSKDFMAEHPEMCEDRQAQRRLDSCMESLANLEEVMFERCCDELEWEVMDLLDRVASRPTDSDGNVMLKDNPDLMESFRDLFGLFSMMPETRDLAVEAVRRDFRDIMRDLASALYDRERPAAEIGEYAHWNDADLISEILSIGAEAAELRSKAAGGRLERARIIASTPQQFLSRFRPRGSDEDPREELDVDHIFLDEACYCGLVQALCLFTNGIPVTMLGDHMQLPPVSQLDADAVRSAAERGGLLQDAYLWSMSALHCERLLREGAGSLRRVFLDGLQPDLRLTSRSDLTESHRFGPNLARILDAHVYRNGMTGSSDNGDLELWCLDATCECREGRENRGEADAVRDLLRWETPDPSSLAILTPYTSQVRLLRSTVGRRYADCVMTVHGSQGREWDTVVFSVSDNGVLSRDVPFRFTSSRTETGRTIVNTAVSRARRRLVMVCDREFWIGMEGELVGELLRGVPRERVITACAVRR